MEIKKGKTVADRIKDKQDQKVLREKLNVDENTTVTIEKKNFFISLLQFFERTFINIFKVAVVLIIAILCSIGLTVLINEPLRELFIDILSEAILA